MFQKINLGRGDRLLRALWGIFVLISYNTGGAIAVWIWPVAVLALASAAMASCPIYALFGVTTRPWQPGLVQAPSAE